MIYSFRVLLFAVLLKKIKYTHYHTALRKILAKEELPGTKLDELDGTEDPSKMFGDEDVYNEYAEPDMVIKLTIMNARINQVINLYIFNV